VSKFLSIRQVAEALSISEITCYRHVETGLIPSVKLGARRLVPAEFLYKLEAEALEKPTSATGQAEA
jgi:excisionase family DNA binding protein